MGRACCLCVSLICSCRSFNGVSSLAVVVPSLYIIAFPCRLSVSLIRSVIILYGPLSEFPSISVAHRHSVSVTSKKKKKPAVCRCLFALGVCALSIVHMYMHTYIDMCVVDGQFTIYRYTNSRLPVLGWQPVYSDPWVNRNSLQMLICISVLRTQINKAQRSGWNKKNNPCGSDQFYV